MDQRVSLITLGVADLAKAKSFYEALGWRGQEIQETVFFQTDAGATITKPAQETFYGGYAGFFADLDRHVWEIAHNPGFTLTDEGELILPDFGVSGAGA